jgi:hypothetical protein
MTIAEMSIKMSDRQLDILRGLIIKVNDNVFEYEGAIFRGNKQRACWEFAYNNPTGGDFFVWLQDNYQIITK